MTKIRIRIKKKIRTPFATIFSIDPTWHRICDI